MAYLPSVLRHTRRGSVSIQARSLIAISFLLLAGAYARIARLVVCTHA